VIRSVLFYYAAWCRVELRFKCQSNIQNLVLSIRSCYFKIILPVDPRLFGCEDFLFILNDDIIAI